MGVPPAPPRHKIFSISCSFWEIFDKIVCWCPPRVGTPSYEESWIRPCCISHVGLHWPVQGRVTPLGLISFILMHFSAQLLPNIYWRNIPIRKSTYSQHPPPPRPTVSPPYRIHGCTYPLSAPQGRTPSPSFLQTVKPSNSHIRPMRE